MTSRYIAALLLVALGAAGVLVYQRVVPGTPAGQMGPGGGRPGGGPPGGRRFGPQPMLVEAAPVTRADIEERLDLVGNLVGAATVEVAPKVDGRLRDIQVRLGDAVTRGQVVGRVEDDELQQQLSQREAAYEVARATVRQRESDLALAASTRERSASLFARELVARQELDDSEARFQAAQAQLDLSRAQFDEAGARLAELRINLENTVLLSPVDGFIGRRYLDPGAYVTSNTAVVSVVDINLVRLVANIVERDLRLVTRGVRAHIEVDAFPDESFSGRVARVAPVLDPATRTAEIEIEIPNPDYRLKPGMYARVGLGVGSKSQALVVPRAALVVRTSARGVFVVDGAGGAPSARFAALVTGLEDDRYVEVVDGVAEGVRVVTTGAAGLQHGDPILLPGARPGAAGRGAGAPAGASPAGGRPVDGPPAGGAPAGGPPAGERVAGVPVAAGAGAPAAVPGGPAAGTAPGAERSTRAAPGEVPAREEPAPDGAIVGAALVEALRSGTKRPD